MKWSGLALVALCACGPRATPVSKPAIANLAEPDAGAGAGDGDDAAAPPSACEQECRARYPDYVDQDGGFAAYCAASCGPPVDNFECHEHCMTSHEPGGSYDENGDYQQDPDERTPEEIDAEDAQCIKDCQLPDVSSTLDGCVDACTTGGTPEPRCDVDCDPDPYDECVYEPCD